MKFEEIEIGDYLDGGNGLLVYVTDKEDNYISARVINLCNIYADIYTTEEVKYFHKTTEQHFKKALNTVYNYYASDEYKN